MWENFSKSKILRRGRGRPHRHLRDGVAVFEKQASQPVSTNLNPQGPEGEFFSADFDELIGLLETIRSRMVV
jgi:hypothetical protein